MGRKKELRSFNNQSCNMDSAGISSKIVNKLCPIFDFFIKLISVSFINLLGSFEFNVSDTDIMFRRIQQF